VHGTQLALGAALYQVEGAPWARCAIVAARSLKLIVRSVKRRIATLCFVMALTLLVAALLLGSYYLRSNPSRPNELTGHIYVVGRGLSRVYVRKNEMWTLLALWVGTALTAAVGTFLREPKISDNDRARATYSKDSGRDEPT
jgi:hypothetical protein